MCKHYNKQQLSMHLSIAFKANSAFTIPVKLLQCLIYSFQSLTGVWAVLPSGLQWHSYFPLLLYYEKHY